MMYQRSWEPGGRDPVPPACSYWELSTASSSRAGAGCGAFSSWVPPGGKTKKIQCLDCSPSCPAQTSTLVMDHHHPALHSWIKVYSKPDTSTHQTQKRIVLWNIYSETHISIHIYVHILFTAVRTTKPISFWSEMQIWCWKDQQWFCERTYTYLCVLKTDCKWNIMVRTVQLNQISYLFGNSVLVFPACWKSYLCFSEQLAEQ